MSGSGTGDTARPGPAPGLIHQARCWAEALLGPNPRTISSGRARCCSANASSRSTYPARSPSRTALSATAAISSDASGTRNSLGSAKAHVHRRAAARKPFASNTGAAADSPPGASSGAGEAGRRRWPSNCALEEARPRCVVAVVSAMRSR